MAANKKYPNHVKLRAPMTFVCLHCGEMFDMYPVSPVPVNVVLGAMKGFSKDHEQCKYDPLFGHACIHCCAFGHEPEKCSRLEYGGDFRNWMVGPDTGRSSLVICQKLSGHMTLTPASVPYDDADFGRCHRLLHAIPGWRARIGEMKGVSPQWKALAENWDALEAMFVARETRKLYERIAELIDGASL